MNILLVLYNLNLGYFLIDHFFMALWLQSRLVLI